jgi:hypothetical protein
MKLKITYEGLILNVQGTLIYEDESVGIFNNYFEAYEIKHKDLDVFDDYDLDQLDEIETICLKEIRDIDQGNWETAKV